MPLSIVTPGGQPSGWVSQEHQIVATDIIDADGLYTDKEGNRFQFRKGHVLAPGQKAGLTLAGDYPEAGNQGEAELAATVPSKEEQAVADKAAADKAAADAKAAADKAAAAKAQTPPENKAAPSPQNKSA